MQAQQLFLSMFQPLALVAQLTSSSTINWLELFDEMNCQRQALWTDSPNKSPDSEQQQQIKLESKLSLGSLIENVKLGNSDNLEGNTALGNQAVLYQSGFSSLVSGALFWSIKLTTLKKEPRSNSWPQIQRLAYCQMASLVPNLTCPTSYNSKFKKLVN